MTRLSFTYNEKQFYLSAFNGLG
uniref:Uncharacterized protein n=1 Tax=Rhizophora mucronata TaxID=61149 RepID=A0A2P2NM25_RHIMU